MTPTTEQKTYLVFFQGFGLLFPLEAEDILIGVLTFCFFTYLWVEAENNSKAIVLYSIDILLAFKLIIASRLDDYSSR